MAQDLLHQPSTHPQADPFDPGLLQGVVEGSVRLTPTQGLALLRDMPLMELGRLADARCRAVHGDSIRTYVIDRNINYTNVCTAKCTFCAFRRDEGDDDAGATTSQRTLLSTWRRLRLHSDAPLRKAKESVWLFYARAGVLEV